MLDCCRGGDLKSRTPRSLFSQVHPQPFAWQAGGFGAAIAALWGFLFPPVEGEKADLVPPLHMGVQEQLGRPELLAGVDDSMLVQRLQRLRLIFVNFSIFVF